MRKERVDFVNAVVWIPDSRTANGIAEVPLTELALTAFREQMAVAGDGPYLFPTAKSPVGHQVTFKTGWAATLRRPRSHTSGFTTCAPRMPRV